MHTLLIMHILVFYANHKVTTKILSQSHIFQVCLQHRIKVAVQLKRKHMLYLKVFRGSTITYEAQNVP